VNNQLLGATSRSSEPFMEQVQILTSLSLFVNHLYLLSFLFLFSCLLQPPLRRDAYTRTTILGIY
jgi:hypothetical protein